MSDNWLYDHGKMLARLSYIWLAFGVGLVFVLQPDVNVGSREVLERLPIPFSAYGVILLIIGCAKVYATITDDGRVMSACMLISMVFWFLLGAGFGASACLDPVRVPFTGLVVFWFIAFLHIIGAGIESSRDMVRRRG